MPVEELTAACLVDKSFRLLFIISYLLILNASTTDIESKLRIVEKLIHGNDYHLLNKIKSLLNLADMDFWDELPEKLKKDIDEAQQQFNNGMGRSHASVMAEVRERFLK